MRTEKTLWEDQYSYAIMSDNTTVCVCCGKKSIGIDPPVFFICWQCHTPEDAMSGHNSDEFLEVQSVEKKDQYFPKDRFDAAIAALRKDGIGLTWAQEMILKRELVAPKK